MPLSAAHTDRTTSLPGPLPDPCQASVPAAVTAEQRQHFKQLLRRIGSGEHTSKGLSREEAAESLDLMLNSGATPAQIGAFLIAHRIRRPEPQELAGMLDTYRLLGPKLTGAGPEAATSPPLCFGMPFDGRSRTAPVYPLTALLLLAAGRPVVLCGGERMPVKYGVTAQELFAALDLDLGGLPIERVQEGFQTHGLALLHQPDHFPLAQSLIPYREDLGKRPPVASLELLWTAHRGEHLLISGFVHPPTEARAWQALQLAGEDQIVTVKGLEGSTDLPTSRAGVTAGVDNSGSQRLILHPRDHDCYGPDLAWESEQAWACAAAEALEGNGPLAKQLIWNGGCYLWFSDRSRPLADAVRQARQLIATGAVKATLQKLVAWRHGLMAAGDDVGR